MIHIYFCDKCKRKEELCEYDYKRYVKDSYKCPYGCNIDMRKANPKPQNKTKA